ncbi:MAG: hypothetical protein ACRDRW_19845 [Pseudonocardiaceae bacterium]
MGSKTALGIALGGDSPGALTALVRASNHAGPTIADDPLDRWRARFGEMFALVAAIHFDGEGCAA